VLFKRDPYTAGRQALHITGGQARHRDGGQAAKQLTLLLKPDKQVLRSFSPSFSNFSLPTVNLNPGGPVQRGPDYPGGP